MSRLSPWKVVRFDERRMSFLVSNLFIYSLLHMRYLESSIKKGMVGKDSPINLKSSRCPHDLINWVVTIGIRALGYRSQKYKSNVKYSHAD